MLRKYLWLLLLVSFLLASCGSGQLFGPIVTSTSTVTSTPTVAPTSTLTPIPTSTPTPEIPKPSVPHGLRMENSSSQMLENGTWVVKNVEGKITATWNAETQSWTYSPENIKVSYTQIGNEVYQSVLEPYMGSLPPDDPATHFKDENGNPVDYGIGPETRIEVMGGGTIPLTEVFARYRGFVPLASFYPHLPGASALILEIPRTPDTSIIVVIYGGTKYFYILATPDDSAIYDRYNIIHPHEWVTADTAIPIANEHLIGQMVMILVQTDSATGEYAYLNQNAKTFLDFIAGTSTHIPLFGLNEGFNIHSGIIAPVSSMPQP